MAEPGATKVEPATAAEVTKALLEKIKQQIRREQYKQALVTGEKAIENGQISAELLQLLAMASFLDDNESMSVGYIDQTLRLTEAIEFPLLFETSGKKHIGGTLAISRTMISFTSDGQNSAPGKILLSLGLAQIKSVYDDVRREALNLFKKKKNRTNPILIVKDQRNRRYSLQLLSDDPPLRKFIRHVINTVRKKQA